MQMSDAQPVMAKCPWDELLARLTSKWPLRAKATTRKYVGEQGAFELAFTKTTSDAGAMEPVFFMADQHGMVHDSSTALRRDYQRIRLLANGGAVSARTLFDARNGACVKLANTWKNTTPGNVEKAKASLVTGLDAGEQYIWKP